MLQIEKGPKILAEPDYAAAVAGLHYISDEETPGIRRERRGRGFIYRDSDGRVLTDQSLKERIGALAIPPAWTSVWISPDPNAHIVATGRDAKGRKQYRYNTTFLEIRGRAKFYHLIAFAESLPKIRKAVEARLKLPGMPREKVLATVIALLEQTLIRVGNRGYARENGSFGLTTLRNKHVRIQGSELRFLFKGKGGKIWRLNVKNARVAKIIRACQEFPGQQLFQYLDSDGKPQHVTSTDINGYLREASGRDVTAKDFRTWAATVEAALAFHALQGPPLKKNIREVVTQVAEKLGNTATVCRKCYIHPLVIDAYEKDELRLGKDVDAASADTSDLDRAEQAVLHLLKSRDQARA